MTPAEIEAFEASMTRPRAKYTRRLILQVAGWSSLTGAICTWIAFGALGFPIFSIEALGPVTLFAPISVITWIILYPAIRRESIWSVIFYGAVSPIVGCIVSLLYVGMGILIFPMIVGYWYIFVPLGIGSAFVMRSCVKDDDVGARGLEVETKAPRLEEQSSVSQP